METSDSEASAEGGSNKGGIITARGTGDGLVVRLDGRVDRAHLKEALHEFVSSRRSFLAGNSVALEWVGVRPEDAFVEELSAELSKTYDITIRSSRLREQNKPVESVASSQASSKSPGSGSSKLSASTSRSVSLFDGIEALAGRAAMEGPAPEVLDERRSGSVATDPSLWDDPDTRIVYTTLRSGQKIETEHSLVIFGDVNSGAELIAGGDIIVLGTLRGVAHAGAYDETGGGRVIFALDLRPTQLRIGMVISRGNSSEGSGPEMARVDGTTIVVEPYQSKSMANRRRL